MIQYNPIQWSNHNSPVSLLGHYHDDLRGLRRHISSHLVWEVHRSGMIIMLLKMIRGMTIMVFFTETRRIITLFVFMMILANSLLPMFSLESWYELENKTVPLFFQGLCNLWSSLHLFADPDHREQLQQHLREVQDWGGDQGKEDEVLVGRC